MYRRRGLQAERKDVEDSQLVLKALRARIPLMRNPWQSVRKLREAAGIQAKPVLETVVKPRSKAIVKSAKAGKISSLDSSSTSNQQQGPAFFSENLIDSIPAGLNAPVSRLVLAAALKCFDPNADGGGGDFVLPEDFSVDPFQSYLDLQAPLPKVSYIRRHLLIPATY